jgi:SAM-dependent methyltransferase
MTSSVQLAQWERDEAAVFEGWDFAYIGDRSSQDEPPWSYPDRAAELIRTAQRLLDVDTGGGERLATLAPLPRATTAIEGYHPNVAVARARLAPFGVAVEEVAVGACWPFADAAFDLILNRHGHINEREIARTLTHGGVFFSQQVGSDNLADLVATFDDVTSPGGNALAAVAARLEAEGLVISRGETWSGQQTFRDVGALVYFLRAVPWVVPGFSVKSHRTGLARLQERLDSDGELAFSISRFLVEARRSNRHSGLPITGRAR